MKRANNEEFNEFHELDEGNLDEEIDGLELDI